MEQHLLLKAQVLCRHIGSDFQDVWDLSQQIMEALDRNDQISVQLLLHMRAESIEKAKNDDKALRSFLTSIEDAKERQELLALLNCSASGGIPMEQSLAKQASNNASQLQRIIQLDRRLNQRMTREKSVYR